MMNSFSYRKAENIAEQVIADKGFQDLPIDPFLIASKEEIEVCSKETEGVSGMLVQDGDVFGIIYSTHIKSEGFQRFTVAHELGHFFLPEPFDHIFKNGNCHASEGGFVSKDPFELEADYFAAALLMPDSLFAPAMRKTGEGLEAIERLAKTCITSLTSTAIRYIQRTELPEAMVMSIGDYVEFCFMSDALKGVGKIDWIKKGDPLPVHSASREFNKNKRNVLDAERRSLCGDFQDWFGGKREIEIEEQVIGLGSYERTLTIITVTDDLEADEDGDDSVWNRRIKRHY